MKDILKIESENKNCNSYTELLKNFQELSREVAELTVRNRELELENKKSNIFNSKLFGSISHEIKTPLFGILTSVSLLKKNHKLNDEEAFNLHCIEQNSHYLLTTLNDLLDYSNIENNSLKLNKVNFELISELDPLLKFYQIKVEEKGVKFQVKIGHNVPKYLKGDPLRIKQIVHHLLSNSLNNEHNRLIEFRINAYNLDYRSVEIEMGVTYEGIGISDVLKERVFHKFFGEHTDNAFLEENMEIGMLLVKKLVELMDGSVNVNSKNETGITISATIPLEPGLAGSNKDRFKNILLVEDNIINQKLTKTVLDSQGFNVDTASNGKIGVENIVITITIWC